MNWQRLTEAVMTDTAQGSAPMGPRLLHYSDVENAYDDPERIGRLAGLINRLDGEDALVAGTGDNTAPGVLSLVTEGKQALDFFQAIEPDVDTFGNHDFDYGPDRTREIVERSPQTWVSSNVGAAGEPFAADEGTVPWTIREVDGARIGLLGVTDPKTPSINPEATDVEFRSPIPAAREAAEQLRERGIDYLVVLSHLGTGDEDLVPELDADAVLGGHVHTERIERMNGTVLTRPGVNGGVLMEIDLESGTVTRHPVEDGPLDEAVAAALRERMAAAGLDEAVATVEDPIERTEATTFRGESRIGNFVADAYRWATDADVGLQNSGGIREGDPLEGEIAVADLVSVVPFQEQVAVAELTGDELRTALRQASGTNLAFGEPDWWHAHMSGVEVVWNHATGELERATVGGEPIRPEATYTVATSDYVFHTDHEFPVIDREHRQGTHGVQYEVLAEYAREVGVQPELEGRVVRNGTE